ncbi:MAG: DUF4332 domain-containing protein [Bacteroidota bacterium]
MAIPVGKLKGMSAQLAKIVRQQGITNSDQYLAAVKTKAQRKALAQMAGVDEATVREAGNRADLNRISGIGGVYSDLLEVAGVDTVAELKNRNAANLHAKMTEVNAEKNLTKRVPPLSLVETWVATAKTMERGMEY